MNNRIISAISNIKMLDQAYWINTLEQRLPSGAGSVVTQILTSEELEKAIIEANWERYESENIMEGCSAFITYDIKGEMGVVRLDELLKETSVIMDDRKGTGRCTPIVKGINRVPVHFTVLILGMENDKEVVFTFHPGPPIRPSQVIGNKGEEMTAEAAIALGCVYAKIE